MPTPQQPHRPRRARNQRLGRRGLAALGIAGLVLAPQPAYAVGLDFDFNLPSFGAFKDFDAFKNLGGMADSWSWSWSSDNSADVADVTKIVGGGQAQADGQKFDCVGANGEMTVVSWQSTGGDLSGQLAQQLNKMANNISCDQLIAGLQSDNQSAVLAELLQNNQQKQPKPPQQVTIPRQENPVTIAKPDAAQEPPTFITKPPKDRPEEPAPRPEVQLPPQRPAPEDIRPEERQNQPDGQQKPNPDQPNVVVVTKPPSDNETVVVEGDTANGDPTAEPTTDPSATPTDGATATPTTEPTTDPSSTTSPTSSTGTTGGSTDTSGSTNSSTDTTSDSDWESEDIAEDELAYTGADLLPLGIIGGALLICGIAIRVTLKRRRA